MDKQKPAVYSIDDVRRLLLHYRCGHVDGCPQASQNYWRMRPEYRPPNYGPDKPCGCGLDDLLGQVDQRSAQR